MAITTLAGAESGIQYPYYFNKAGTTATSGYPRDYLYNTGFPAAASAPSPGIAGAALTTYAGQIPFKNPASGNTYLARLTAMMDAPVVAGWVLTLADRLWHNSSIVINNTTSQTINSVTWPARDITQSINGDGVYIGVEVSAATGAQAAVLSLNYTNSASTAGKIGTFVIPPAATAQPVGTFLPIGLAAGDTGVKSIQTLTFTTAWTTGTIHLVAYRPIASLVVRSGVSSAIDALTSGFPRLWNDSVPFMYSLCSSSNVLDAVSGSILYTQG